MMKIQATLNLAVAYHKSYHQFPELSRQWEDKLKTEEKMLLYQAEFPQAKNPHDIIEAEDFVDSECEAP